eukprot:10738264-Lingulodinium_polyedra.AAC.1
MRSAQRGDFPKLIPFHSGPITMFLVSTKKGEEDWVKCKDCRKWLDGGPTCSHCASGARRYKAAEALE